MFDLCKKTEQFLAQLGVEREYSESVGYGELAPDWELVNLGRPEDQSREEDAILNYADMMRRGSPAPAVILRKKADRLLVLDGCQRLMANKLNESTHCAAYIVRCNDTTARLIRIVANQRLNSQAPVKQDWTVDRLVQEFVLTDTYSCTECAVALGVRTSVVEEAADLQRMRLTVDAAIREHGDREITLNKSQLRCLLKHSVPDDWAEPRATKLIVKALEQLDAAKSTHNNSAWNKKVSALLGPRPKPKVKRATQLNSVFKSEFERDVAFQKALTGKIKRGPLNNLIQSLKGVVTAARTYKKATKSCKLDMVDQVREMHEYYLELGKIVRECCSESVCKEINFPKGPFKNC